MRMNKLRKPENDFTQIPNGLLRDRNVSLKAKGVYCLLFSKPDDWIYIEEVLVRESTDGRDAFRSAITELARAGWLSKKQVMEKGAFGHTEIWLHAVAGKSVDGLSVDVKSDTTKTDKTNTDEIIPSVSPHPTKATKRATLPLRRLKEFLEPTDGAAPPEFGEYACKLGWDSDRSGRVWTKFERYWGSPDAKGGGRKRDWLGTWQNWCDREAENGGRGGGNGTGADRGLAAAMRSSFHGRNGAAQPDGAVSGGQGADATGADGGGTSGRLVGGEIAF